MVECYVEVLKGRTLAYSLHKSVQGSAMTEEELKFAAVASKGCAEEVLDVEVLAARVLVVGVLAAGVLVVGVVDEMELAVGVELAVVEHAAQSVVDACMIEKPLLAESSSGIAAAIVFGIAAGLVLRSVVAEVLD